MGMKIDQSQRQWRTHRTVLKAVQETAFAGTANGKWAALKDTYGLSNDGLMALTAKCKNIEIRARSTMGNDETGTILVYLVNENGDARLAASIALITGTLNATDLLGGAACTYCDSHAPTGYPSGDVSATNAPANEMGITRLATHGAEYVLCLFTAFDGSALNTEGLAVDIRECD
jgi:hypothetical protein